MKMTTEKTTVPVSDCTGELHEQSVELAQLCRYLDVIADIPGRYRLSNFGIWIYLMEISPTAESSIVMGEENSWHIGGEEYTVRLTPLENWQQAVELVLDFVQEMLDEIAMYDQPKEDGWQLTRTYPFIVRKHVDDGRQPPPGLVTEEERTTLLRRFAAFFKGKSVQTWQMHASKFPHDKEKDYTFGIFHEHVLFAVEGKRYWLRAEFSD